jgi:hypothetical protein
MVRAEYVTQKGLLFAVNFISKEKIRQFEDYTKLQGRII